MNIEKQQDVGYIKSYILSRDLTFSQMSPKMLKPKEIHKFSQGNSVFNVVAFCYNFQGRESKMWQT